MDLENFQSYQSSTYGGASAADDTASLISGYTTALTVNVVDDLDTPSFTDEPSKTFTHNSTQHDRRHISKTVRLEDDLEGVLDDLKDDAAIDLPSHACR